MAVQAVSSAPSAEPQAQPAPSTPKKEALEVPPALGDRLSGGPIGSARALREALTLNAVSIPPGASDAEVARLAEKQTWPAQYQGAVQRATAQLKEPASGPAAADPDRAAVARRAHLASGQMRARGLLSQLDGQARAPAASPALPAQTAPAQTAPAQTAPAQETKPTAGGRELKPGEGIDPFGNLILWHNDAKTGLRDGYQILEHAPGNVAPDGSTVVAQLYNAKYPEQSYREFSNGTRVAWDGKVPELAKPQTTPGTELPGGPTAAPKEVVEAFKKEYLAAVGVPLNQGQLELYGYTQAIRDPQYMELIKKQGEAVQTAYQSSLGRPPTQREREYWVTVAPDLEMMKCGLNSLNNPAKTDKESLENIAKSLSASPDIVRGEPAGDLPATPTKQGLIGVDLERALIKERSPLVDPPFAQTPADKAAFERLRATSKLRGVDITDNPSSAGWAQQMLESGTAKDPAFYAMVDDTLAAVRAAYQKELNRAPTQAELAEWLPFTPNMDYNRRRAAEVLVELQDRKNIDFVTNRINKR